MRHLRAFLYFFVGVLVALNASFAFSASIVPGNYYDNGDSIGRKSQQYNDSKKLTSQILDSYKIDPNWNQFKSKIDFGVERNMTKMDIFDSYKIPTGPMVDAAKKGAERGFKGLRGGIPGVVGMVAGGLVMDVLVSEGLQWYEENQQWNKMEQTGFATRCDTAGNPACSGYAYYASNSGFIYLKIGAAKLLSIPSASEAVSYAQGTLPSLYMPYTFKEYKHNLTSGYTDICLQGQYGRTDCSRVYYYNQTKPAYQEPKSPVPITEAQLDDAIKRAIDSNLKPFVQALQQDQTAIELDDGTVTTVVGDPVTGTPKVTTTTQVNPDGSRTTENKKATPIYAPTSTGTSTINDDIAISTQTITETTTNTCAADGTCEVTEKTETENKTEQTDCQKNPSQVSCMGLGDIPDVDIPANEKRVTFSSHQFSMNATCPAPVTFTARGSVYSISYQPICDFAGYIRALVMLSALIAAYFICFGTRKEGV